MRSSPRASRVAAAIREAIASYLVTAAGDPRFARAVITDVEVTADFRIAKVYYHELGDPEDARGTPEHDEIGEALQGASGRLKNAIRDHVRLRFVPELRFFYDDTLDAARRIDAILHELDIPPEDEASSEEQGTDDEADLADERGE